MGVVWFLGAMGVNAVAADKACLLEGKLTVGGQVLEIKDCMFNAGVDGARFVETCKGIAEIGAGMGAPPKVTYLAACPTAPQAVCEGMMGQPVHSYYYKRSASDLEDSKSSCLNQGGKWRTPK
jgi:hypothetical protein